MLTCTTCGKPVDGLCLPCEERRLAETFQDKQMFTCPVCGTRSKQAWIDGVCDDCVDTVDGEAVQAKG